MLNIISGFGPTAGAALCSHMDVDKVRMPIPISLKDIYSLLKKKKIVPRRGF